MGRPWVGYINDVQTKGRGRLPVVCCVVEVVLCCVVLEAVLCAVEGVYWARNYYLLWVA